jgi:hypothetical protein
MQKLWHLPYEKRGLMQKLWHLLSQRSVYAKNLASYPLDAKSLVSFSSPMQEVLYLSALGSFFMPGYKKSCIFSVAYARGLVSFHGAHTKILA